MKRLWSSLTVRLVVASLTWTAGLLYVAHVASVFLLFGSDALSRFGSRFFPTLAAAVALMTFGAIAVRRPLQALGELRRRLVDVHEGREPLVVGDYVNEVKPVVDALNGLLEHQNRRVREALAKAGDLAHGLKTPLAVLHHEADCAEAAGHRDLAASLRHQITRMERHIEYHLAYARAAASGATPGARCPVGESVAAIARTLERLHAHRGLAIETFVPDDHVVRGERADLDEILGNLLDNACKWTRARIVVTSTAVQGRVVITVDDDGSGIPSAMREAVLQRGVRADEAAPGSGFGLAIVRDLVELYGGSIVLDVAPLGGARARVELPQAVTSHSGGVQVA